MRKTHVAGIFAFGGLALIIAVKLIVPSTLPPREGAAAESEDEIVLNGVLYDFSRAHPDFAVVPAGGFGHYAGSVGRVLPGTRRPDFAGDGFKVLTEWEDSDGRPIAPHIAGVRGGLSRSTLGFRVDGEIELKDKATVDGFNSNYGPYGILGNFGRDAVISTNSVDRHAVKLHKKSFVRGDVLIGAGGVPSEVIDNDGYITGRRAAMDEPFEMPQLALPEDLEPYQDRIEIEGEVTLTGDVTPDDEMNDPAMYCGELKVKHDAIVTIEGDLVIRCDRKLDIDKSQITLLPDASLTIYVSNAGGSEGDVKIRDNARVNVDPGDTARVNIIAVGPGKLEIDKSHVYATILAPERQLKLKSEGHFYGGFVGESLKIEDRAGLHVDLGNAVPGHANYALSVREEIKLEEHSTIDSFDSNEGPYGGANVGADAWVSTNATYDKEKVELKQNSEIRGDLSIGPFGDESKVIKIESGSYVTGTIGKLSTPHAIPVTAAPAVGSSVGDLEYTGGEHRIDRNLRCKKLKLDDRAILTIVGQVTLCIDDKLELKDSSEIQLDPGSTLTLYVGKEIKIEKMSELNTRTGNPQLVSIFLGPTGKTKMKLKEQSRACAWVQGARAEIQVEDRSEFFGSFTGRKCKVKNNSWFHVDMAYLRQCVDVFDTAGAAGVASTGGIESATSFDQWFRDVLGANQSIGHPITLARTGRGDYVHFDDAFYPADGRLLGNEGEAHNNYFTYAIWARFEYQDCGGQFLEFEGGDGAWVFVDGTLAIDLGGVRSQTEQYIEFDRLGLEPGKTYSIHLFYAQRQAGDSVFRLRTNVELIADKTIPSVSAQFD